MGRVGRLEGEAQVQASEPLKVLTVFRRGSALMPHEPGSQEFSATVVRRIAVERDTLMGWCVGVSVARCEGMQRGYAVKKRNPTKFKT